VEPDPVIGDWQLGRTGRLFSLTGDLRPVKMARTPALCDPERRHLPGGSWLLAPDPEPGDQRPVSLDIVVLHVVEKATSASDELHQPSPGVVVTRWILEVLGEVVMRPVRSGYLHLR